MLGEHQRSFETEKQELPTACIVSFFSDENAENELPNKRIHLLGSMTNEASVQCKLNNDLSAKFMQCPLLRQMRDTDNGEALNRSVLLTVIIYQPKLIINYYIIQGGIYS